MFSAASRKSMNGATSAGVAPFIVAIAAFASQTSSRWIKR